MVKVPLYDMEGTKLGEIELKDDVFGVPVRKDIIHQVLLMQLAGARRGTASTRTRGEVRGGGRKPWRQKGTGRARHGSRRSPIWKGGGITFGPKPRDYSFQVPKKVRRLALKSVLSDKVKSNNLLAVKEIKMPEIKTRDFVSFLSRLPLKDGKVLVVLKGRNINVEKSAANIPDVKIIFTSTINLHDMLKYEKLLMSEDAIREVEEVLGR
ncbi:MAG: 50S ribosomal protein L4 [Candidatus Eremiobacteraeota bacterium]|nr:50S ribosomal protein L4 [Candidatus Eremiobacteraeota bacterium]